MMKSFQRAVVMAPKAGMKKAATVARAALLKCGAQRAA
jgi:hypothetical protein